MGTACDESERGEGVSKGKQCFLVCLDTLHSKYTDREWRLLTKHMENYDGSDLYWSIHTPTTKKIKSGRVQTRSIACGSFKNKLSMGEMLSLIRKG